MSCTHCGAPKLLARGLCQPCYHRLRRNGSVQRKNVVRVETCIIDGCESPAEARNLCTFHYAKAQHHLKNTWKLIRSRYRGQYPEQWESFERFVADAGARPSPAHQLRRKRNLEPWSVENSQWISRLGGNKNSFGPQYGRDWALQTKYNLTRDEHDAIHAEQGGRCAICGTDKAHRSTTHRVALHVDHCHETKVVRGLLCAGCNRGLGYFNDDPVLLRKAIAYLTKKRKVAA